MKKLAAGLFLLLFVFYGFADKIVLNDGSTGVSIVADELSNFRGPKLVVKCDVGQISKRVISTPKGKFTQIALAGYHDSNEAGNPALPLMHHLVEVPFGAKLDVRIISKVEKEYTFEQLGIDYPIMPCQPSLRKDKQFEFNYNEKAYQKDEYISYPLAQIKEVGVLRCYRVAFLQIAPISYNPVQKKIRVCEKLYLELPMRGSDLQKTANIKQRYYSPYFEWPQQQMLVADSLRALSPEYKSVPVSYVIISDRLFEQELKPFVETKTVKGFRVKVAYTDEIGKSKEQIQQYLHGLYNNATVKQPAPTFVLLVGDSEQIPPFDGTEGSYVTDLYYAAVTADKLPDMYYGRFSAQTKDDVLAQVEKTLEYEQYRLPDPTFLSNVVLVAGWDWSHAAEWGYPQINYGQKYYFNESHGIKKVTKFLSAGSHQNETAIFDAISAGATFVNYTAHGSSNEWSDPTFPKANIEKLTNNSRYSLLVGNCCLTNKFDVDTCFGEAWLRIRGKGAIGYIGGSSYTYWDEDLWSGVGYYNILHPNDAGVPPEKSQTKDGAYDGAFEVGFFCNDGFIMAGNLAVEDSNSKLKTYYWEVYHLMGDPSLMIYWGIPTKMNVSHPTEVKIGATQIIVHSEPGAYVGITMKGKLYGAGIVDDNGTATIIIEPFSEEGAAAIAVTKKNREPYLDDIDVAN